jgi:hypothetical protein
MDLGHGVPRSRRKSEMDKIDCITTYPPKQDSRNEKWDAYVDRVRSWKNEILVRRRKAGVHRQIFAIDPNAPIEVLGAFQTLAMICYAKGHRYHPIELSRRSMAALMNYKCDRAQQKGQQMIDDLIEFGAMSEVEPGAGKRASVYCIGLVGLKDHKTQGEKILVGLKDHKADPCGHCIQRPTPSILKESPEKERTATADQFEEHEVVDTTSTYVQTKKEEQRKETQKKEVVADLEISNREEKKESHPKLFSEDEIISEAMRLFDNAIPPKKIKGLIMTTSPENVQMQLEWFPERDTSSFTRGPAAAFCVFCAQEVGEPESLKLKKRLAKEREAEVAEKILKEKQEEERKEKEAASGRRFEEIWSEMQQEERDKWLQENREAMIPRMRYQDGLEDTIVFQGRLRAIVLQAYTH